MKLINYSSETNKSITAIIVILSLLAISPESEAKGGFGSLFKAGRGLSTVNNVKNYDSNTLTVRQLKQCLDLESAVEDSEDDLSKSLESLKAKRNLLSSKEESMKSLGRYLKQNQNVSFYNQEEVDVFNLKVDKYNSLVPLYDTEFKDYRDLEYSYNTKVNAHNIKIEWFKEKCANKRYYEDDYLAIKNGLK